MAKKQKTLPCKFFYDKRGSEIFDQICQLEEYYITRVELEIMSACARSMLNFAEHGVHLIEFGSGSSQKVRHLFDTNKNIVAYTAIDISREHLVESCARLSREYSDISVSAICADYTKEFNLPKLPFPKARKVGYFPGSSIGNFLREEAVEFLKRAGELLGPNSQMLVGIDLKKDREVLEAAYNDSQGVTAEFNLNILQRAVKELGVSIDIERFRHQSVYNQEIGRIETHILSTEVQSLDWRGKIINFDAGEKIHTENSYKYSIEEVHALASDGGYLLETSWLDEKSFFGVHLLALKE